MWPLYSPDLAPSDFHLFLRLKNGFREHCFYNNDDTKDGVRQRLSSMVASFYEGGIEKLVPRYAKGLNNGRNYVGKYFWISSFLYGNTFCCKIKLSVCFSFKKVLAIWTSIFIWTRNYNNEQITRNYINVFFQELTMIFGPFLNYFLGILTILISLIYFYFKWSFQFWKRKGVPQLNPFFPFGNRNFHLSVSFGEDIYNICEEARQKGN